MLAVLGKRGVSVTKAKGKGKTTGKKPAAKKPAAPKKTKPRVKKGKDLVQVRESIDNKIKNSANKIADKVIAVATTTGQLASAKYLFEAVGLYPAPAVERSEAQAKEVGLAETLLNRMGIPLEPVVDEDDRTPLLTGSRVAAAKVEDAAEENVGGESTVEGQGQGGIAE